ncbi:MAG: FecR family protein [Rhodanobacteraceae bacterium]
MRRQAEHWFARRLDTPVPESERVEFERWLAEDPEHVSAYREVDHLWSLAREAARHPDVATVANQILESTAERRSWRRIPVPSFAIAALLVALVGLGTLVWCEVFARQDATLYMTRTGEQRNVTLRDGSHLLLDTGSAVTVAYGRRARRVDLRCGRVEFSVQHDPKWPFIVRAGKGTVTDLGTTFQMSVADNNAVKVVLIRGKVSVAIAGSKTALHPGQGLEFNAAGIVHPVHSVDLGSALAWTRGELVVHDWPLARVVASMNRYSHLKVDIADASLWNIRVTGSFRVGDQHTLVKILETGWPIRAMQTSPETISLFATRHGSLGSPDD